MSSIMKVVGIGVAVVSAVCAKKFIDYELTKAYMNGYEDGKESEKAISNLNNATDELFDLLNKMKQEPIMVKVERKPDVNQMERIKNMALVEKYGIDEAIRIRWNELNNKKG